MTLRSIHLGRSLLLGLLIAALAFAALAAIATSSRDPATLLSIFTTRFLGIFIEAVPFLLLGVLISGLIDAFVRPDDIARLVPRRVFLAVLAGAFLGFLFPVCECGVVPVVRRLYTKGLPIAVGVTFLLAAPVINPIVLVSTYVAYGFGPMLIARFGLTLLIAIIVGLIFALAARPREVLRTSSIMPTLRRAPAGGSPDAVAADIGLPLPAPEPRTWKGGLRVAAQSATNDFFDMGRYLVIGCLLAAAMQTFIAQDTLATVGSGPVTSVIVMQLLAIVLSVCSTVDAFLSLAFVNTFTWGAILAFLTLGPMVDIKSIAMYLGVYKPRVVAYLVILPFLLTLLAGVWVNLNIPS